MFLKKKFSIIAVALSVFGFLSFTHAQEESKPLVWVTEIRGSINPGSADYLRSSIAEAKEAKVELLLVELDTPGGLVASVRDMAQAVDASEVPVVVYVTPAGASATSAGALLMLASHVAAMAPGTNIGAAHPVGPQGKDVDGAMGEKVVNDVAAFSRGLAEIRNRNVDVAEQVVRKSLSLTAKEAKEKKFIEIIAEDRADLLKQLNGMKIKTKAGEKTLSTEGATVVAHAMRMGQKLLDLLANPNVAAILMTLAMLLIYVEVSNPGVTIAGVLGAICLVVAFMSYQVMPVTTGGIVLLVLGALMLIAEPLVGAAGALGAGGALAFCLGLLWVVDPEASGMELSMTVFIPIAVMLFSGVGIIAYSMARMKTLSAEALDRIGGSGLSGLSGYVGTVASVSKNGLKGKANFRGELWNFESVVPVKEGTKVTAEKIKGIRVWVRPRPELKEE